MREEIERKRRGRGEVGARVERSPTDRRLGSFNHPVRAKGPHCVPPCELGHFEPFDR